MEDTCLICICHILFLTCSPMGTQELTVGKSWRLCLLIFSLLLYLCAFATTLSTPRMVHNRYISSSDFALVDQHIWSVFIYCNVQLLYCFKNQKKSNLHNFISLAYHSVIKTILSYDLLINIVKYPVFQRNFFKNWNEMWATSVVNGGEKSQF